MNVFVFVCLLEWFIPLVQLPPSLSTSHDDYDTSHDDYDTSHDVYDTSHDDYDTSHDDYDTSHDDYDTSHDDYDTSHDDYDTSHDDYDTSHDDYDTSHDDYDTSHDDYDTVTTLHLSGWMSTSRPQPDASEEYNPKLSPGNAQYLHNLDDTRRTTAHPNGCPLELLEQKIAI